MDTRILIIGTVPYNERMTSRAFDAYFSGWNRSSLRQIFSNPLVPSKGHCSSFYQITDYRVLKRWFDHKYVTGKIFNYDELDNLQSNNDNSLFENIGYKVGRKHTSLTHLLRGILWKKKYWCTNMLTTWLDEFNPQVVFLAFSDDFFINQIALFVAERYKIPIIACIGDDYIFNKHFSLNPFYLIYKNIYIHLIRKVFSKTKNAIYISDKIKEKYNREFNLNGETVYLTSKISRKTFSPINIDKPIITYFGNIRAGRNKSLYRLADVFKKINNSYVLEVYSNENDSKYYTILQNHSNIKYMGAIPYDDVKKRMLDSDITVIVEGFDKKDIEYTRYSLSTKAADALASGSLIVVFGSFECGLIEYLNDTFAAVVSDNEDDLLRKLTRVLNNVEEQKKLYNRAVKVYSANHNLNVSNNTFKNIVDKTIS